MRYSLAFAALVSLAAATPSPQVFDFNLIDQAPSPTATVPPLAAISDSVTVNPAAESSAASAAVTAVATGINKMKRGAASSTGTATTSSTSSCPTQPEAGTYCGFINPEDSCAKQPDGYGPVPNPDTVEAFEAYPEWTTDALGAKSPSGYAQTFKNLNASVSANSYLGLVTLHSYDTQGCSEWCDNTTLCTGFNIYVERDPSLNPSDGCEVPASISNYKCTLWGSGVETAAATNYGGYRGQFQVVIAGSDGYEKTNNTTPATPPGCSKPTKCPSGSVNSPGSCIGTNFFPGAFNMHLCADYAKITNAYNKLHSKGKSYPQCKSFNAYTIKRDGKAQGTYCSLFEEVVQASLGKYQPGWLNKHFWGIESSFISQLH